jgi:XapX domain-containing protein
MKPYLLSLALGLLVGIIYALFGVRSPAPPVIALVGLLGILLGEQVPPLVKQMWQKEPIAVSWFSDHVRPHVFGTMPKGASVPEVASRQAPRTSRGESA